MRTSEIIATLAVVGTVATLGLVNMNSMPAHLSFIQGDDEVSQAYVQYLAKYRKSYGTQEEFKHRQAVFSANYHTIMHHNMMNSREEGYYMAINQFADMTAEEFKMRLGYK